MLLACTTAARKLEGSARTLHHHNDQDGERLVVLPMFSPWLQSYNTSSISFWGLAAKKNTTRWNIINYIFLFLHFFCIDGRCNQETSDLCNFHLRTAKIKWWKFIPFSLSFLFWFPCNQERFTHIVKGPWGALFYLAYLFFSLSSPP